MRNNDQSNRIIKWIVTVGDFVLLNAILLGFAHWHWRMGTWQTGRVWNGADVLKKKIIHKECNKIQRESLILQPNSRTELRQNGGRSAKNQSELPQKAKVKCHKKPKRQDGYATDEPVGVEGVERQNLIEGAI